MRNLASRHKITERSVINWRTMARTETIADEDLTRRFIATFRESGYAGTSVRDLSNAAGLTKAALYHRFPDGKDGMAAAALDMVCREMDGTVLATLDGQTPLPVRLSHMMDALERFYADGAHACLIELFSQQSAPQSLRDAVRSSTGRWISTLADALVAGGIPPEVARTRSRNALIGIQGALVLCRALDDRQPFAELLARLPLELMATQTDPPTGERRNGT
ncbi:TetR/AcrR family transcriptional regulator [Luteimonas sp. BDR2-5]|uniref:TetR/AcrR family transcriptional regulator n=1 Tax=Proluteimonas luteida TaxID=2878685 RepID=UPI001E3855AF|nr:TetR/AcrR family transcriptional regulator [Luteimonas sp. BDR2-5]MCD9027226.1 TetR/AcrR family transcriptional regulator [Luteimonas sp. BDR2-5]